MHARRQKFFAQAGQRRRLGSAKQVRSNREIELINKTAFQERSKQSRTAFAGNSANVVFFAQRAQHGGKIDMLRVA